MDEVSKLNKHIQSVVSLTAEELQAFTDAFERKILEKNELFLEEGAVCDFIGFVVQGAMIYFKTLDNGTEVTIDFAFEGDWVTNNLSRLNDWPSQIGVKAIEPSEVYVLKQSVLADLYLKIPQIERLGRILMEQAYLKIVSQSIDLQVLSASERYARLLNRYPEIFQKVPLYHIANYLGIAPKSLSRIRKEIFDR